MVCYYFLDSLSTTKTRTKGLNTHTQITICHTMSHHVTAQNGLNLNSTLQIAWHGGDRCKKLNYFTKCCFCCSLPINILRKKNQLRAPQAPPPSQVSVSEIAAPYPLVSRIAWKIALSQYTMLCKKCTNIYKINKTKANECNQPSDREARLLKPALSYRLEDCFIPVHSGYVRYVQTNTNPTNAINQAIL